LQVLTPSARHHHKQTYPFAPQGPPDPKRPNELQMCIRFYARTLYIAEGHHYQNDPNIERQLRKLAHRIVQRIAATIASVELAGKVRSVSLAHHGLTDDQMREAAFDELNKLISSRLNPKPTPSSPPPPLELRERLAYTASGVDIASGSPLLIMAAAAGRAQQIETPKENPPAPVFAVELERLLIEARLTPESIADVVGINWRTVYRHRNGEFQPSLKNVGAYEKALTKLLNRKITLPTPVRRQNASKKSGKRQ
jgi:hypothetical protein